MSVKIKKAKLKDGMFLEVLYTEDLKDHARKETSLTCTIPVHDDLKSQMQKLHKHLAVLCDEVKVKGKSIDDFDHPDLSFFHVRGFTLSGMDEGVTISGYKEGTYGNVNLNTPFTKRSSEDYKFVSEMFENIEAVVYEVEQYLFHGKRAPEAQLELFPAGDDGDAAEYSEPEL